MKVQFTTYIIIIVQTATLMVYPYNYQSQSARTAIVSSIPCFSASFSVRKRSQLLHQSAWGQIELRRQRQQGLKAKGIKKLRQQASVKYDQNLRKMSRKRKIEAQVAASKWRQQVYRAQLAEIKQARYLRNANKIKFKLGQPYKQTATAQRSDDYGLQTQERKNKRRDFQDYQEEFLKHLRRNQQCLHMHKAVTQRSMAHPKQLFRTLDQMDQITTLKPQGRGWRKANQAQRYFSCSRASEKHSCSRKANKPNKQQGQARASIKISERPKQISPAYDKSCRTRRSSAKMLWVINTHGLGVSRNQS